MLYCCKITKRHKREKISSEQILCLFLGLRKFILKFKKFFKLGARKFNSLKHTKLFKSRFFFIFRAREVTFWKMRSFLGFPFLEIYEISVSWNIRNAFSQNFFYFSSLWQKVCLVAFFCKSLHRRCLTGFWMGWVWIYLSQNIRKFRFLKIKKAFLRKYKKLFQISHF